MPYKSVNEINEIVNEKMSHEINYEECRYIVGYLYNKADAIKIFSKIEQSFKNYNK